MSDVARAVHLYRCDRPYDQNTFFPVARNNLTALKRITTGPETFFLRHIQFNNIYLYFTCTKYIHLGVLL